MQQDKGREGGEGDRLPDRCDVACMRKRWRVSGEQVMELGYVQTRAGGAVRAEQRRGFEAPLDVVGFFKL